MIFVFVAVGVIVIGISVLSVALYQKPLDPRVPVWVTRLRRRGGSVPAVFFSRPARADFDERVTKTCKVCAPKAARGDHYHMHVRGRGEIWIEIDWGGI